MQRQLFFMLLCLCSGDCLEKWTNILQNKISPGDRTSDVMGFAHLLVWMCKAMVLRGHKSQQFYIAEVRFCRVLFSADGYSFMSDISRFASGIMG